MPDQHVGKWGQLSSCIPVFGRQKVLDSSLNDNPPSKKRAPYRVIGNMEYPLNEIWNMEHEHENGNMGHSPYMK